MAYDMFKCPKCGNIVDEHAWIVVKIKEDKPNDDEDNWTDGFECMDCDSIYSGEELTKLVEEYSRYESEVKPINPFAE